MQTSGQRTTSGFTLVEMLFVLAIAGILLTIGAMSVIKSANTAKNDGFIEGLAQDINLARSAAMSRGSKVQVRFISTNSYIVNTLDASGNAVSPALSTQSNTNVVMSGIAAGDKLVCSTVGFCLGYTSTGVLKTIDHVDITAGSRTRTLSITVLGLTRTES